MKTCLAFILLMLSLAGLSAVAVSHDSIMDTIRLPSDGTGLDDLFTEMTRAAQDGEEKKRPWKCCDHAVCALSLPPKCRCLDKVDRCSNACEKCEETEDSRYTCADVYHDIPGPVCKDDHETRPWDCCNEQMCTKSQTPTCRCLDLFERCAKACKRCEEVKTSGHHKRYRCLDSYFGEMAPPCGLQGGMQ